MFGRPAGLLDTSYRRFLSGANQVIEFALDDDREGSIGE